MIVKYVCIKKLEYSLNLFCKLEKVKHFSAIFDAKDFVGGNFLLNYLLFFIFSVKIVSGKANIEGSEASLDESGNESNFQRLFGQVPWGLYSSPNRVSTSTQTAGVRRSAGTQTPQDT
jgi:hypothetical protein